MTTAGTWDQNYCKSPVIFVHSSKKITAVTDHGSCGGSWSLAIVRKLEKVRKTVSQKFEMHF